MSRYSFIKKAVKDFNSNNTDKKHISVIGVLKPLSVGSITNILNCKPIELSNKINYQLSRITELMTELQEKISNPKYEKVKKNNEFELRVVRQAYVIHRAYFTKLMYFRGKGIIKNPRSLENLQTMYKRQLFILSQNYKKTKIMSSVPPETSNLNSNDNTQIPED